MREISLHEIHAGDVLARDIYVEDVFLFGAGTVLTGNRVDILSELKVSHVIIEDRHKKYRSIKELFANIDKRFSYVENNQLMQHIKYWIKDIIANAREKNETAS